MRDCSEILKCCSLLRNCYHVCQVAFLVTAPRTRDTICLVICRTLVWTCVQLQTSAIIWTFLAVSGTAGWSCGRRRRKPFANEHLGSCSSLFVLLWENLRRIEEVRSQGRSAAFHPADSQFSLLTGPHPQTACLSHGLCSEVATLQPSPSQQPGNREQTLSEQFELIKTIKSTCGFRMQKSLLDIAF